MGEEVCVVQATFLVRGEVGVGWVEAEAALGGIGDEEDQSVGEEVEGFCGGVSTRELWRGEWVSDGVETGLKRRSRDDLVDPV